MRLVICGLDPQNEGRPSCPGPLYQPGCLRDVPPTSPADRIGFDLIKGIVDLVDRERPLRPVVISLTDEQPENA